MDFLEKDLEDILFNANQDDVFNRGLETFFYDKIFRQVRIPAYGIIDLLTISYHSHNKTILITVYELKNKKLSADAFWQTLRYIKAVKHVIGRVNKKNHDVIIEGIMIGREVDESNDFCFLPTLKSNIKIYTYDYKLDGMIFEEVRDVYLKSAYNDDFNFNQLGENSRYSFLKSLFKPQEKPPF